MKIYLAGPEVFLSDSKEIGDQKCRICSDYGFEGIYPADNKMIEAVGGSLSRAYFRENIRKIDESQLMIANLSPFRSVSADPGTVFEVAYGFAREIPVFGYSADRRVLLQRILGDHDQPLRGKDDRLYAPDGFSIEDFALADNLMIIESICARGGRIVTADSAVPADWRDLTIFESCVRAVAEAYPPHMISRLPPEGRAT